MTQDNENGNEKRNGNRYVTNKVLVSLLVGLCISMGGYIFKGIDKGNDVQAYDIATLKKMSAKHDVEIATLQTTITLNYGEFIRRLEKIEQQNERIERHVVVRPNAIPAPTVIERPILGVWPNCRPTQSSVQAANGEWFCQNR